MAYHQSSLHFSRALKASTDPPKAGEPFKIQIAEQAWNATSFHVPNKSEIIVGFILTRLFKDRTRDPSTNSVLDLQYWDLLANVLTSPVSQPSIEPSFAHKTWLVLLLNRTPIAPIVTSLLLLCSKLDQQDRRLLHDTASRSLTLLWSLGVQKCSAEVLLDCFGAVLQVPFDEEDSGYLKISCLVTSSLRTVFGHASHKKKLHQIFLQAHLESWIHHVHCACQRSCNDDAFSATYATGIEIIFNVDTFQQISEDPASSPLFASLTTSQSHPAILSSLPLLFRSFSQAVRKNRSLSGQGQSLVRMARPIAMRFFSACENYLKHQPNADQVAMWTARRGLLEVVEADNLLVVGQLEGQEELRDDVRLSASLLGPVASACTALALKCLCIISLIDHDLVEARISSILSSLLCLPSSPEMVLLASELLSLFLSHHSKARTLPALLSHILRSVMDLSKDLFLGNMYSRTATSPLLSREYLSKLSKAIGSFVTPGQVASTAKDALSMLTDAYENLALAERQGSADRGVGPRKKSRKSDPGVRSTSDEVQIFAVSFVHTATLALTVIRALPQNTVVESVQVDIQQSIDVVLRGPVQSAFNTALQSLEGTNNDDRRRSRQEDLSSVQVVPVTLLASTMYLKCKYEVNVDDVREVFPDAFMRAVEASNGLGRLGVPVEVSSDAETTLVGSLGTDDILPEFYLEIARFLLERSIRIAFIRKDRVIDAILTYLETHLPPAHLSATSWSGFAAELDLQGGGKEAVSVGLLRLVLDRYLPVLEAYGPAQHRGRVIELILKICAHTPTPVGPSEMLSPSIVVIECLHSAQFWEQSNLRSSFMAAVDTKLESLDDVDILETGKIAPQSSDGSGPTHAQVDEAIQAYNILLYTPGEYLSRSARVGLLRRAIALDFILAGMEPSKQRPNAVTIARTCVLKLLSLTGSAEHAELGHLHFLIRTSLSCDHNVLTLDIIQHYFQTLARTANNGSEELFIDVVNSLKQLLHKSSSSIDTTRHSWTQSVVRCFMSTVAENSNTTSLPKALLSTLRALFNQVVAELQLAVDPSHGLDWACSVLCRLDELRLWSQGLSFGAWLGVDNLPPPGLGLLLMQALSSHMSHLTSDLTDTVHTVFSLLLSELTCYPIGQRQVHLDSIVAAYMIFSKAASLRGELDVVLTKAVRNLTSPEFGHCLELVQDSIFNYRDINSLPTLVHLCSLMLQGAPEGGVYAYTEKYIAHRKETGTLKVVQSHLTQWLIAFVDLPTFTSSSPLRLQVLKFINRQCSDRHLTELRQPGSIRPINMMSIWSLLTKVLSGSSEKDTKPTVLPFHEAVSIVGALVRLRRDLVLNTLPHLCSVLRQLVFSLRSPRPLLGAKQHNIVSGSLPAWISGEGALGIDESKAFARLLTTLATKSVIRVHGPNAELQKPESLARPLSKYVVYVLQAYIEALNDPLCVLSSGVRHEVQPGLFALCDMLNEHARDASMVSALDAGGKAAMKALWREYEKQRYVGKEVSRFRLVQTAVKMNPDGNTYTKFYSC
ncbi:Urb2/Npa2 family-domain-containing protein [Amylostereum chailletii]|nr:Urb2/Npa2 family-domain-containing protein [Amylostereum chailletii]